jgi:nitroreductase
MTTLPALPATVAETVLHVIRTRRSQPHVLPDREPPRAVIDTLLEAATHAPNHYLTQPWRFFVLRGEARLRLGEVIMDEGLRRWPAPTPEAEAQRRKHVPLSFTRAPVVIVVAAVPGAHPHVPPWEDLAATAAAMQSILIAAHAMGLAAYWRSNGTESQHAKRFLGLPPEAQLVGFIYVGYPDPQATLPEKPRRPHTEFVRWLGWDGDVESHGQTDGRPPDGRA